MEERHRVFVDEVKVTEGTQQRWDDQGDLLVDATISVEDHSYDSLFDVVVPNFAERSRNGELFFNPFSRLTFTESSTDGTMTGSNSSNGQTSLEAGPWATYLWGSVYGPGIDPSLSSEYLQDIQNLEDHTRFLALSRVDQSRYDFGEDLAELGKTLASIRKLLVEVSTILKQLKLLVKRYRAQNLSEQQAFAKAWLRIRYEIRPIIISIQHLIEIANEGLKTRGTRASARASQKLEEVSDEVETVTYNDFTYEWHVKRTLKVVASSGILYSDASPRNVLEELGLGVGDILPTIWAVTKFSFLVDKFIDVASSIEGIQNSLNWDIEYLGAWTTTSIQETFTAEITHRSHPDWVFSVSNLSTSLDSTRKRRNPYRPSISDASPFTGVIDADWSTLIDLFTIFGTPK